MLGKQLFLMASIFTLVHFYVQHKLYVNKSDVLTAAIEEQLLSGRSLDYQHLPYSSTRGDYIFCNKKTFSHEDTQGLQNYALNKTHQSEDVVRQKTAEEIIKELKMEKCIFERDDLFSFVVVKDSDVAQ
jgi:regulatory protein YycI of two-component signal transduction system YycFG